MDGGIAGPNPKRKTWGILPKNQDFLRRILNETVAELVISSSWRYVTVHQTIDYFNKQGFLFCDRITGVTPRLYLEGVSIPRGVEIQQFIREHVWQHGKWEKVGDTYVYVILDDDSDMLYTQRDYFIKTDSRIGLTEEITQKAIDILNQYD